ncbi:MAG: methionine adenosyltransferase domain-containing protein, partial [Abditibacteriota bacterium]|nr:methionine adenosyltransferase domain-containing protein [Abditibacteriota bacterium]
MRYVAKNIVAAGIANRCEVWVAYAIGEAESIGVFADTYGTGKISDDKIVSLIRECFNLEPLGIIETLNLRRPIYKATSAYGHFGRTDIDLPWEKTDMAVVLKEKAGL